MIYGTTEFYIVKGSLKIRKTKRQKVMHYIGTNDAEVYEQGREPTVVTCTIIATTESDRVLYEQLLHTEGTSTLTIDDYYYKSVTAGGANDISKEGSYWLLDAEFIALDPIPYDVNTGEAKY